MANLSVYTVTDSVASVTSQRQIVVCQLLCGGSWYVGNDQVMETRACLLATWLRLALGPYAMTSQRLFVSIRTRSGV